VEVVFPVAREAITTKQQEVAEGRVSLPGGLAVLPGPPAGEGCSQEGGCAACPYMKMNSLRSLLSPPLLAPTLLCVV
jgi:quinolinate synthase